MHHIAGEAVRVRLLWLLESWGTSRTSRAHFFRSTFPLEDACMQRQRYCCKPDGETHATHTQTGEEQSLLPGCVEAVRKMDRFSPQHAPALGQKCAFLGMVGVCTKVANTAWAYATSDPRLKRPAFTARVPDLNQAWAPCRCAVQCTGGSDRW